MRDAEVVALSAAVKRRLQELHAADHSAGMLAGTAFVPLSLNRPVPLNFGFRYPSIPISGTPQFRFFRYPFISISGTPGTP